MKPSIFPILFAGKTNVPLAILPERLTVKKDDNSGGIPVKIIVFCASRYA
jgi:hypothetical protein